MSQLEKSKRTYTKRRSDLVLAFCAAVIVYTLVFRDESPIADAVIGWCFTIIAAVLGIYQAIGHADLRAMITKQEPDK